MSFQFSLYDKKKKLSYANMFQKILDNNMITGYNLKDWLRNFRIVLEFENLGYVLEAEMLMSLRWIWFSNYSRPVLKVLLWIITLIELSVLFLNCSMRVRDMRMFIWSLVVGLVNSHNAHLKVQKLDLRKESQEGFAS